MDKCSGCVCGRGTRVGTAASATASSCVTVRVRRCATVHHRDDMGVGLLLLQLEWGMHAYLHTTPCADGRHGGDFEALALSARQPECAGRRVSDRTSAPEGHSGPPRHLVIAHVRCCNFKLFN